MSKKKQNKNRKSQLAQRSKVESYKFQLEWMLKKKLPDISADNDVFQAEMKVIIEHDLFKAFSDLRDIIGGVKKDLNISPIDDKTTLDGSLMAYLFDITPVNPLNDDGTLKMDDPLLNPDLCKDDSKLRIEIYYDNEVRMKAFEWAKAHGYECIIMAYRPIIKLLHTRVTLQRVMSE